MRPQRPALLRGNREFSNFFGKKRECEGTAIIAGNLKKLAAGKDAIRKKAKRPAFADRIEMLEPG